VDESSLPGLESDHNLVTNLEIASGGLLSMDWWQDITGQDKNSMVGDPEETFSDLSKDDYTLRQGSLAIDKGANLASAVAHDIIGVPRPQGSAYDMGAYEYPAPSLDKNVTHGVVPAEK
jgi:hypothetical protein